MGAAQFSNVRRGRNLKVMLLFAFLWGLIPLSCAGSLPVSRRQKLKVEKLLERLNKPAIKTIESPDGDLIDCVNISHQPAFDHPFLKDHKIQTRPSYHPKGIFDENKMSMGSKGRPKRIAQLWHRNGNCPKGTIPIRRTNKEDVLRASSAKRFGKKNYRSIPKPESADANLANPNAHEHAIAYAEGNYYGARATINVWNPHIAQPNEFSLSQIWVLGGSFGRDLNSIEAGWQVNPGIYGDNNTRLFTYWTTDAYQATGCYNLLCSGFIQVPSQIAMGASILPISLYQSSQYDVTILIFKDSKSGNWWMQFNNDYVIGYWPSILFSNLEDSASMIQWGGEVVNSKPDGVHTSTQMGSGQFPEKEFGKSSYFRNINVVDGSNHLVSPGELSSYTEQPNCYDIQTLKNDKWGHCFYYGGPGINPSCQ